MPFRIANGHTVEEGGTVYFYAHSPPRAVAVRLTDPCPTWAATGKPLTGEDLSRFFDDWEGFLHPTPEATLRARLDAIQRERESHLAAFNALDAELLAVYDLLSPSEPTDAPNP